MQIEKLIEFLNLPKDKQIKNIATLPKEALEDIAVSTEYEEVKKIAIKTMTDDNFNTFVLNPPKKVSKKEISYNKQKSIKDKLFDKSFHSEDLRYEVDKISNEDLLFEIANSGKSDLGSTFDHIYKYRVIKKITNNIHLMTIFKIQEKKYSLDIAEQQILEETLHRITDQKMLKEILLETKSWNLKEIADKKIADKDFIKFVEIKDSEWGSRAKNLEDLKTFTEKDLQLTFLKDDRVEKGRYMNSAALSQIKDQKFLEKQITIELKKENYNSLKIISLTKNIQNQELIKKAFLKLDSYSNKWPVVENLSDKTIIKDLMAMDKDTLKVNDLQLGFLSNQLRKKLYKVSTPKEKIEILRKIRKEIRKEKLENLETSIIKIVEQALAKKEKIQNNFKSAINKLKKEPNLPNIGNEGM